MTTTPPLSVVLGAGQIGARVTQLLLGAGHRVRVVRRAPVTGTHPMLEGRSGDLADERFAIEACQGAQVVYDCSNPAYHQWPAQLLPLGRGALAGARAAGARLVALDNLYMYGRVAGPMTEDTPMAPCSKKGELRAQLARERLEADARGEVAVSIGRASDFYGPGVTNTGVFSERFYQRVLAGKAGEHLGDASQPHAYSYGEDVARGLVTLGGAADARGVWHLPVAPAESTRAVAERLFKAMGVQGTLAPLPGWGITMLGLFLPVARELPEMVYQWEAPFLVSDAKWKARFGGQATSLEEGTKAAGAWAVERWGRR